MDANNLDDYSHPLYSGFGMYTCMRCHSSAKSELTFCARQYQRVREFSWKNADGTPSKTFKSCQDCHMPGGFETKTPAGRHIEIDQLVTKIATIQDTSYPQVEERATADKLDVPHRGDYQRHELVGLNVFLIEMMNQFPEVLGVAPKDNYMSYATTGSSLAMESMLRQARETTVALKLTSPPSIDGNILTADVRVTNLTGHRFPSGVAFRRAFLELLVFEEGNPIPLWASGNTNAAGIILDGAGPSSQPLPTEFLDHLTPGNQFPNYQPHYQTITAQNQVQIYEELITNADNQFTTSFIHRVHHVKDNRLLPKGWVPSDEFKDQGKIMQQFMAATDPEGPTVVGGAPTIGRHPMPNGAYDSQTGEYAPDRNYVSPGPLVGTDDLRYRIALPDGTDAESLSLQLTMYSQSLMPAWLNQRFSQAAWAKAQGYQTPATDRLYYLTSRLNLGGTAMKNWKLPMVSVEAKVEVK